MPAKDRKNIDLGTSEFFSAAQRRSLRRRLLAWYATHKRDLPWRRSPDPYCVWISEIMLQQTQVATVIGYFARFITTFPDIFRLAAAEEVDVLRVWEGLGYYRRAKQLHAAAQQLVAQHGGRFPQDPTELQKLPGIGRYTAGAIASIAFGRRTPILEANTIRLLSRLIAYRGDPHTQLGQRPLWQAAEEILPRSRVAEFNQALMELGSLFCTPDNPKCDACPLASVCQGYAANLQHEIPPAKPRAASTDLTEAAIVVRKNGSVLVRQCADGERWAGLWDFPRFPLEAEGPLFARKEIVTRVQAQTGITCNPGPLIKTLKHGVTRYRITLDCYNAAYVSGRAKARNGNVVRWLPLNKLPSLPLSTTGRKIASLIATTS